MKIILYLTTKLYGLFKHTSKIIHNKLFYNTVKITGVSEKKVSLSVTLPVTLSASQSLFARTECM